MADARKRKHHDIRVLKSAIKDLTGFEKYSVRNISQTGRDITST